MLLEACLAGSLGMWRSTLRDPARGLARELRRFLTYSHSAFPGCSATGVS